MAAMHMTVVNTFLDMIDDSTNQSQSKRSHSVPRSWMPTCPERPKPPRRAPGWADSVDDFSEGTSCGVTMLVTSDTCMVRSGHDGQVSSSMRHIPSEQHHNGDSDGTSSEQSAKKVTLSLCSTIVQETTEPKTQVKLSESVPVLPKDMHEHSGEKVTLTLSLCSAIVQEKTKLKAIAKSFQPLSLSVLPRDMHFVLRAAQATLSSSPKIFNVRMCDGRLGGITTILGSYMRGILEVSELVEVLTTVKTIFLDAAADSSNTYVIGYASNPFTEIGQSGFSTKLASVSSEQEASTCWDFYQNGCCPRGSTCRWSHPCDSHMAQVVVMLNAVDK